MALACIDAGSTSIINRNTYVFPFIAKSDFLSAFVTTIDFSKHVSKSSNIIISKIIFSIPGVWSVHHIYISIHLLLGDKVDLGTGQLGV